MITKQLAVEFFTNLRYESSRGGERGLQPHHIEQFSNALVKFVEENEWCSFVQEVKSLRLQKGDIIIEQRGFNSHDFEKWQCAAKVAGINFEVPIVIVDDIDDIQVKHV